MNRARAYLLTIIFGIATVGATLFALAQVELPQGPGVELIYAKCQQCHGLQIIEGSAGLSPNLWNDLVTRMQRFGLEVSEAERETILNYLVTYLGPNPPPPAAEDDTAEASTTEAAANVDVDGAALFNATCASCHQADGQGILGTFPPLAGHVPVLYEAEGGRNYLINVLLYGLQGEISVSGEVYNGVMPAWSHLQDAEIAAILNYILTAWNNESLLEDFTAYSPEDIASQRGAELSPQEILDMRPAVAKSE